MSHLRFASLGSGSRGNAMLVEAGDTCVLLDSGFSVRETLRRMVESGFDPQRLQAILVTHEHSDHANGVVPLARRLDIPVYLTAGTRAAMEGRGHFDGSAVDCRRIVRGIAFGIGTLAVSPVRVPHDAREPCQFVFEAFGLRLGVLTDAGSLATQVVAAYSGCDALFLETNHDVRMLAEGPYPPALRNRVGGDFGHLSNAQAGQLLLQVDQARLSALAIGHLSEKNNDPVLARATVAAALGWAEEAVVVASQARGHDWIHVTNTTARMAGGTGA